MERVIRQAALFTLALLYFSALLITVQTLPASAAEPAGQENKISRGNKGTGTYLKDTLTEKMAERETAIGDYPLIGLPASLTSHPQPDGE